MDESQDKVLVERRDAVTIVSINRPDSRNAVDPETAGLLLTAFDAFEKDDSQLAAVLYGRGGTFCAGFDLKTVSEGSFEYEPLGEGPMGPTRRLLTKPVIAAVEGHAVAGGLELALWCDMRVASENAVFGVFCRRWGVPLIDGGNVRLPRLIGHSRAMDMILTGRPVAAGEALSFGLANRLVPQGKALEEAVSIATDMARFPQTCLRTDRMTAYQQWGLDVAEALKLEGVEGQVPIREEAEKGASRFASGLGRSGRFDAI
ncbi:crotonase/enoyl-CoA hydratase family protein [Hoeflea prorocentri]|uniref:Crotonase/enoyl-CoA hydratase family protein n=1 Tax=Hoeflea prorocentri TaxID=1922333 RepID=A0A9X3UJ00_9HYPH|nr:crotonase/enoyl-CoA hydratase family protein [Hoeflea prorocentri]MCY6381713.1 crotonase/enoyl-CoA hydratase family protein [Hoeflea prorocentri]MDA5399513.1 crotonase/enoyl-CoA hydratase family protein [Hoeflea prorocentri]